MSEASCSSSSICLRTRWISLDISPNLFGKQTNNIISASSQAAVEGKTGTMRPSECAKFGTHGVGDVITAPRFGARRGGGGGPRLRGDGADAAKGAPAPAEGWKLREPAEAAAVHEMRRRGLHACSLATTRRTRLQQHPPRQSRGVRSEAGDRVGGRRQAPGVKWWSGKRIGGRVNWWWGTESSGGKKHLQWGGAAGSRAATSAGS